MMTKNWKDASGHVVVVGAYPESIVNFRGDLIRAIVQRGHRVTVLAAPASRDIVGQIEALGACYLAYPVQRNSMSVRHDLLTLISLWCAFRKLQPDIVLAYTVKPVIWGGIAAVGLHRVRYYALITGLGFALEGTGIRRRSLASLVTLLFRLSLRGASGVIFQNAENRELFVSRRLVRRELTYRVFGSGVDCVRFSPCPFRPGPATFLIIARLLSAKGLREFATAARLVKQKHPDVVFCIVGGADPSPDRIEVSEVEGWQKEGIVQYLGPADDVRQALADCHVFVLPSYHEGMPRTVLEAMATGRPILTTDVAGCRETVIEGENGFLIPRGNADALAERIEWFLAHRGEWKRMGAVSRKLAEERFDVHLVNSEMLQIMGLGSG